MTKKKERKTDRRTLYTRMVIKDAFLKLKSSLAYNDITISKICTEAEISRGTFYLHYDNIRQVLDEVLDDALILWRSSFRLNGGMHFSAAVLVFAGEQNVPVGFF